MNIVKTPIRSPRANAFAERWVRTTRTECLDWMLVLGRRHLDHVLGEYVFHYGARRLHRGSICEPLRRGRILLRRRAPVCASEDAMFSAV